MLGTEEEIGSWLLPVCVHVQILAMVIGSNILNINYGADDDFTGEAIFRIRTLLDDGDDNYPYKSPPI